jgi:hypothetical protein
LLPGCDLGQVIYYIFGFTGVQPWARHFFIDYLINPFAGSAWPWANHLFMIFVQHCAALGNILLLIISMGVAW